MTHMLPQNAKRNNFTREIEGGASIGQDFQPLVALPKAEDNLSTWRELYFHFEVTTLPSSQKVARRDIQTFLDYMIKEEGTDARICWTPRLSKSFQLYLQMEAKEDKRRRWNNKTVNRILAHLKTFAKWIHKLKEFPLGNPMEKIRALAVASSLEIERAITPPERRRILDAADLLLEIGGRSRDRKRYKKQTRPVRKGYRPYRNRAIVYTLIETGIRRQAVTLIDMESVDFRQGTISVVEKGYIQHSYHISKEGLEAIKDYIELERGQDVLKWGSPALFLSPCTNTRGDGRLKPWTINQVWNEICRRADVKGKSPHSARHAMGKHIMEKTGNISAVQRQLGHKNPAYSMQYSRITAEELKGVLNDR